MWSKMYDNIHDSSECPDDSVINDDDVLDGWFILQRKKREQEKKESDMEQNLNSEISSKQEVFLMASDREEAMKIDSINNQGAQFVKRQRFNKLKKAGQLNQIDFEDEQLKLKTQATEGIRTRLRR
jgi:predicted oxidoreductase